MTLFARPSGLERAPTAQISGPPRLFSRGPVAADRWNMFEARTAAATVSTRVRSWTVLEPRSRSTARSLLYGIINRVFSTLRSHFARFDRVAVAAPAARALGLCAILLDFTTARAWSALKSWKRNAGPRAARARNDVALFLVTPNGLK
ncbi:hypothetical protein EVAR_83410_1 [Eumeta japonica]|uniref:Uncharacterized protein n=1 Tax=Eumeta variegata TaxID=151549 RepID=A0A4C1TYK3_EUMVA|nr:hypothetical protein EVAR_83410_1 [Eumeta japonica]